MLHLDPPPRFLRLKLNPGDSICLPMFLFPKPYLPPRHLCFSHQSRLACYFPGGPVVKNPPFNAGDVGSTSAGGTKTPHAMGQLTHAPSYLIHVPQLQSPHATGREKLHWATTRTQGTQKYIHMNAGSPEEACLLFSRCFLRSATS